MEYWDFLMCSIIGQLGIPPRHTALQADCHAVGKRQLITLKCIVLRPSPSRQGRRENDKRDFMTTLKTRRAIRPPRHRRNGQPRRL